MVSALLGSLPWLELLHVVTTCTGQQRRWRHKPAMGGCGWALNGSHAGFQWEPAQSRSYELPTSLM